MCFLNQKKWREKGWEGGRDRRWGKRETEGRFKTWRNRTSWFPKEGNTYFFFFFFLKNAWQRKYGCKRYPTINQINFPFKKKSKQLGLKEANCTALLFSTFEMKANTALEALTGWWKFLFLSWGPAHRLPGNQIALLRTLPSNNWLWILIFVLMPKWDK